MLSTIFISIVNAESVKNIEYRIVADPLENKGIMEVNIFIDVDSLEYVTIPLLIFNEETFMEFLDYTYTDSLLITGLTYNEETRELSFYVLGSGVVKAYFSISNLYEEIGLGVYLLIVDTDLLRGVVNNCNVTIIMPGNYSIEYFPIGNPIIWLQGEDDFTKIHVQGFGGIVVIMGMAIQVNTTIPTIPQATPIKPSEEARLINTVALIIGIIIGAIVAVVLYYSFRRKTIIIESVDHLRDKTSLLIIEALGKAGKNGLVQTDISKSTNLPKSSVSRRIKRLEKEGYIAVRKSGKYNYITLTDKGWELYEKITKGK